MLQLETNPAVVQLSDLSGLRAGQHAGQWELLAGEVAARAVVQVAGWHVGCHSGRDVGLVAGRKAGPAALVTGPVGLVAGQVVGLVAGQVVVLVAGRPVVQVAGAAERGQEC